SSYLVANLSSRSDTSRSMIGPYLSYRPPTTAGSVSAACRAATTREAVALCRSTQPPKATVIAATTIRISALLLGRPTAFVRRTSIRLLGIEEWAALLQDTIFDRSFNCVGLCAIRQHHETVPKVLMNVATNERVHLVSSGRDSRNVFFRQGRQ